MRTVMMTAMTMMPAGPRPPLSLIFGFSEPGPVPSVPPVPHVPPVPSVPPVPVDFDADDESGCSTVVLQQ